MSTIQTTWTNSTKPVYDQFQVCGIGCSTCMEHIVHAYEQPLFAIFIQLDVVSYI